MRDTGAVIRCQDQDGQAHEHTQLDYEWFSAQVFGSSSNVKVLDTFSNLFGPLPNVSSAASGPPPHTAPGCRS
ncbi:hypothetical protein [Streptomyces mirabilis]|uniref:hypothetical protein n=1 Tax=Streptomyces mirabilis TaxID=68239 RepID=UPI003F4BFBDE